MSSFEKVLVSTGNDRSGDITEGREVFEWIGLGSLVREFLDSMEYVFVRTRT